MSSLALLTTSVVRLTSMKKLFFAIALIMNSCQHDCPPPETVQVPTPPVCEADKAQMTEVSKLKDELAAAKAELALAKSAPKPAPAKAGKK
jgi:hypothetical protein